MASQGRYQAGSQVSTYALAGPVYILFFAVLMGGCALLFIGVAMFYRARAYVQEAAG